MDYTTIIANENIIVKINSCKELAHRMDQSKPKEYSVCPHRQQPTHDDCTILIQWFSSMIACAVKMIE